MNQKREKQASEDYALDSISIVDKYEIICLDPLLQ